MKATVLTLLLVLGCSGFLPGCLVVAGAAVAGGVVYATQGDSSTVYFDQPWEKVYEACLAELDERGSVLVKNKWGGQLEGYAGPASVDIRMEQATKELIKVVVSARKHEGITPAADVANQVAHGISRRLGS